MVLSGKRSRFVSEVVIIENQKQPLVVVIAPKIHHIHIILKLHVNTKR